MEINNQNNNYSNLPLSDLSNLSSTVNLNALKSVDSNNGSNSFNVDASSVVPRSDLSNSLKSILNDMEQAQIAVQQTNNSSTILNEIKTLVQATNNSENPQQSANDAQVEIANLLGTYNSSLSNASQEEGDSTTYFDGRLGAKPISTSEILAAVDERIAQMNVNIKGNKAVLIS